MLLLGLALATTRSDQLSVMSDILEGQASQARTDPELAEALSQTRLALLDPEGALEAASWAPDRAGARQVARRAEEMLSDEREGVWLANTNRHCIDLLSGGEVDAAFVRCVHPEFEARLLEGFERERWGQVRVSLVNGLARRVLGEVRAVSLSEEGVRVLHRVELSPSGIEGELEVCPEGCSDLQVGLAWNGMTDEDREGLSGRSLWAVTRIDLDRVEGQVIDIRLHGVSLLERLDRPLREALVEEKPAPVPPAVEGPQTKEADAPGGGPSDGQGARVLTGLALALGLGSLAVLFRFRKR